jgi:hypothetical protein
MQSGIALHDRAQAGGQQQVAVLDAVGAALLEQPLRAGEPAAATRALALAQQAEPSQNAQRTARGTSPSSSHCLVRARPRFRARRVPPDQVRGHGEPLQVLGSERRIRSACASDSYAGPHARRSQASRPR